MIRNNDNTSIILTQKQLDSLALEVILNDIPSDTTKDIAADFFLFSYQTAEAVCELLKRIGHDFGFTGNWVAITVSKIDNDIFYIRKIN